MPASLLTVTPLTASGISHVFYNIPSQGLIGWFDASRVVGVSSGSSLSGWADSSISGTNATQASAVSQPVWVDAVVNGRAVVRWTAAGQFFDTSSGTIPQPTTVFSVFSCPASNNSALVGNTATGGGESDIFLSTSQFGVFCGTTLLNPSTSSKAWTYAVALINGSASTIRVNGSTVSAGNVGAAGFSTNLRLGSNVGKNATWGGDIAEIMVYNRNLTAAEVQQVESYLTTKYAL